MQHSLYAEAINDYATAVATAQTAITHAQQTKDALLIARGYTALGSALARQAQYDEALVHLQKALSIQIEKDALSDVAKTWHKIGSVNYFLAKYQPAEEAAHAALQAYRALGDQQGQSAAIHNLSVLAWQKYDLTTAQSWAEQVLQLRRAIGDSVGEAHTLGLLALVAGLQGDKNLEETYYQQALPIYRAAEHLSGAASVLTSLGLLSRQRYDFPQARIYLAEAIAIQQEIQDQSNKLLTLSTLGSLEQFVGNLNHAYEYHTQVLSLAQSTGIRRNQVEALNNLGALSREQADFEAAHDYLQSALDLSRDIQFYLGEGVVLFNLGILAWLQNEVKKADDLFTQALAVYDQLDPLPYVAETKVWLARTALSLKQTDRANTYINDVLLHLENTPLWGEIENRDWAFLVTIEVLTALQHPQATAVAHTAYTHLQAIANQLPDDKARHAFWHHLPVRHTIWQMMQDQ